MPAARRMMYVIMLVFFYAMVILLDWSPLYVVVFVSYIHMYVGGGVFFVLTSTMYTLGDYSDSVI